MGVIAQQTAEALISSLFLGPAIAVLAWAMLRTFAPDKAASRFLVWFSALGAIALVPLIQVFLRDESSSSGWLRPGHSWIVLSADWALYALWSWIFLTAVGLTRVALGVLHLRGLRSASTIINLADLTPEIRENLARVAQKRLFELRTSDAVRVPMAIGFSKPAILIPTDLVRELSPVQLNQILLHETAHLLRYDDWTNLIQKIAQAVLFFHPAVWFLERELALEREMACDEAVVAQTSDARSYAQSLALLAERSVFKRSLVLVQTAVSRLRHTSLRVAAILAQDNKKAARTWRGAAAAAGVVVFSAALVQAPNLVSFQENTPPGEMAEVHAGPILPDQKESAAARVVPAMFKQAVKKSAGTSRVTVAKAQNLSTPTEPPRSRRADQPGPGVVLASARNERMVPVVVATEMVVERSGSGVSEQVFGVWQVTIYYSTAEKKAEAVPRKT